MGGHLTRREFLHAGGLLCLGSGMFFNLKGCEFLGGPGSEPQLFFEQLEAGCAMAEEGATLEGDRGRIIFSGVMITPNPCYSLHAELRPMRCAQAQGRCPNTYEVAITAKAQEGYCILCIGGISYRGEIRLEPGLYTIVITHDGRSVASAQLQVE